MLYGRDLVLSNYRWRDLAHVYALTLLLIPVNLGGVARSLHQWWTGRHPVFARTPKVTGRTAAPAFYIVASLAVPVWTAIVGSSWLYHGQIGRVQCRREDFSQCQLGQDDQAVGGGYRPRVAHA